MFSKTRDSLDTISSVSICINRPDITFVWFLQVLSVCSSYFQKIFLDHPSSHPILFMTDVNSNHMAGLLDFMYSGQVNLAARKLVYCILNIILILLCKGERQIRRSSKIPESSRSNANQRTSQRGMNFFKC